MKILPLCSDQNVKFVIINKMLKGTYYARFYKM